MKFLRVKIIMATALFFLLLPFIFSPVRKQNTQNRELASLNHAIEEWDQTDLSLFSNVGFAIGKGLKSANLKSIVFVDFQCDDCFNNYKMNAERIQKDLSLGVLYKLYPHDNSCNSFTKRTGNSLSCDLSYLALCAQQSGMKDSEILGQMFQTYRDLKGHGYNSRKIFESIRVRFKIENKQFANCQKDPRLKFKIQKMILEASSNPTLVLPGVYIQNRFYIAGTKTRAVESLYDQLLSSYNQP